MLLSPIPSGKLESRTAEILGAPRAATLEEMRAVQGKDLVRTGVLHAGVCAGQAAVSCTHRSGSHAAHYVLMRGYKQLIEADMMFLHILCAQHV